jgi:DNA topoisomerase I
VDVRSEDINAYLKDAAGEDFSAKDFRTWNATLLAAVALAGMGAAPETKGGRRRRINDAVDAVAEFLGNTPAVCRQSYIDPRVFDRYRDGETIKPATRRVASAEQVYDPKVQRSLERAVIRLLD